MTSPLFFDSITVSVVAHAKATKTTDAKLSDVLSGIRSGQWAAPVACVRKAFQSGGKTAADPLKLKLPAVLF